MSWLVIINSFDRIRQSRIFKTIEILKQGKKEKIMIPSQSNV